MKLVTYPHPVLRVRSAAVSHVGKREQRLLKQMLTHMRRWKGVGLAAPQVGITAQLVVAEAEGRTVLWANPEVLEESGQDYMEEGCLSVPETAVEIGRATRIWVRAIDEEGGEVEQKLEGLLARVIQHEIDHLHGTLIIDYGVRGTTRNVAATGEKER